jgi:hypothetical protein
MVRHQLQIVQLALDVHQALVQHLGVAHDLLALGVVRLAPRQHVRKIRQVCSHWDVVCMHHDDAYTTVDARGVASLHRSLYACRTTARAR